MYSYTREGNSSAAVFFLLFRRKLIKLIEYLPTNQYFAFNWHFIRFQNKKSVIVKIPRSKFKKFFCIIPTFYFQIFLNELAAKRVKLSALFACIYHSAEGWNEVHLFQWRKNFVFWYASVKCSIKTISSSGNTEGTESVDGDFENFWCRYACDLPRFCFKFCL